MTKGTLSLISEPATASVKSVFDELNSGTEALDIFNRYRTAQKEWIRSQLGTVKLLGMSQPRRLLDIYHPVRFSTTIFRRLYETQWLDGKNWTHPHAMAETAGRTTVDGSEYIEKHDRVVVLASPGTGKTTFLKFLALAYASQEVFDSSKLRTPLVPFFVYLSRYATSDDAGSIEDYIIRGLEKQTTPHARSYVQRLLEKGCAILLLDGLDEISEPVRRKVVADIEEMAARYPDAKFVTSCRTADYQQVMEQFYEVEIMKMTPAAVKKTVDMWFKDDPGMGATLVRQLERQRDVFDLVQTPLLLSLLCIQFRHDLQLPRRRTELYKRCIEALLRDWDASRGFRRDSDYAALDDERKMRIFEFVAGQYAEDRIQYVFPDDELAALIGEYCTRFGVERESGVGILAEIEQHHGILERISANSFIFSHPMIHEYFLARRLLTERREGEVVRRFLTDPDWSNVIEFIVSMHEDPWPILSRIMQESSLKDIQNYPAMARRIGMLWLLYRCLSVGASIEPSYVDELAEHFIDSQVEMTRIYQQGGVFPVPQLVKDGVTYGYVYYRQRRTLEQALQTLRIFGNEIYGAPVEKYAEKVVERVETIVQGTEWTLSHAALALSLLVPIASARREQVRALLSLLAERDKKGICGQLAGESVRVLSKGS